MKKKQAQNILKKLFLVKINFTHFSIKYDFRKNLMKDEKKIFELF